ncbi:hypothetical protein KBY55_09425 [Streptomyces sp. b94]|uniref:hypothetical protein n=1 Tax=Streptomyces sp. b94 TaxID=1827634 RepID=UPI001B35C0D3|nr:hypothetical protein [Streptomyces sp. b94]MBQ1096303.1 hypothetical protein [Streptomyces sp. b94]
MTAFTRGFRLHLADGRALDGAAFPSGRTLVVDDPEFGLATITTSVEVLLQGYHGARVEWDDEALLDGQPRPTADSITSDQLDALLLKAAALSRVRAYLEARLDTVAVDTAAVFNMCLPGAGEAS